MMRSKVVDQSTVKKEFKKFPNPSSKIYICFLPTGISEGQVQSMFCRFGQIQNIKLSAKQDGFTYCYITYSSISQAREAVRTLHKHVMGQKILKVNFALSKKNYTTTRKSSQKKNIANFFQYINEITIEENKSNIRDKEEKSFIKVFEELENQSNQVVLTTQKQSKKSAKRNKRKHKQQEYLHQSNSEPKKQFNDSLLMQKIQKMIAKYMTENKQKIQLIQKTDLPKCVERQQIKQQDNLAFVNVFSSDEEDSMSTKATQSQIQESFTKRYF